MAGHTSVVMNLGGVKQYVWVPLSRDAALAAGLTPSEPQGSGMPSPVAPPAQPEGHTGEDVVAMEDGSAEESKAAMKAAYMRFHRSVNSILA